METDRRTIADGFRLQGRGQWFGFGIGTIVILAGLLGALYAPNIWGQILSAIIGGGGLVGLVSVFVIGQKRQDSANSPAGTAITQDPNTDPLTKD